MACMHCRERHDLIRNAFAAYHNGDQETLDKAVARIAETSKEDVRVLMKFLSFEKFGRDK